MKRNSLSRTGNQARGRIENAKSPSESSYPTEPSVPTDQQQTAARAGSRARDSPLMKSSTGAPSPLWKNGLDLRVLQPRADGVGLPPRRPGGHRHWRCGRGSARRSSEQLRASAHPSSRMSMKKTATRLHGLPINPVIGGEGRDRAQDRGPSEIISGLGPTFSMAGSSRRHSC